MSLTGHNARRRMAALVEMAKQNMRETIDEAIVEVRKQVVTKVDKSIAKLESEGSIAPISDEINLGAMTKKELEGYAFAKYGVDLDLRKNKETLVEEVQSLETR